MKVLILNGSPRNNGNTTLAIKEIENEFKKNYVDYETIQVGQLSIRGCIACNKCSELNKCIFDDIVNEIAIKFKEADGLIIASPVYYASANGTLINLLQRLFYSTNFDKSMKVGCSVVVARRGGCSATFDELNKFFTISNMPIVSSTYWNSVHGRKVGEASLDLEGLQTMRNLARNMIFLMKSIQLGKDKFGLPILNKGNYTNFIK